MTRSMVAMRDVSLLTYLLTYLYMISSGTRQQHLTVTVTEGNDNQLLRLLLSRIMYRVVQKNGATSHPISLQILQKLHDRIALEIGDLLQYYMLNTVINFLFKNFIALQRHLAKTLLLSFIYIVQIDLSITQQLCFRQVAPQCDEIFKQKKLMTVFSI